METRMDISDMLSAPVLNNEMSALEQDVKLKALEESIGDARAKIKHKVIEEAVQVKSCLGVEVGTRKGGQTLNYSEDEEWAELEKKKKEREKLLKQAWEMRQSDPDSQLVVSSEEIPVIGIKSYTAESIVYKFR